jgi:hypothetical protein
MGGLPRKLPPFLHPETSRHGRAIWYFRRGKGRRVRLPDEFGPVEFWGAYEAATKGARPQRAEHAPGSFAWALAAYKQSHGWLALSAATQRQRFNIFKHVEKKLGASKLRDWKRGDMVAGRMREPRLPHRASIS